MRATAGSAGAGRGGGGRAPCKVLAGACVGATAGPLPPPLIVACVCGRHGGGPWPAAGPAGHRSGESPAARPVQPDKRGGRRAAASAQPRAHRRQRTAATSAPPAAAVAASAPPSPPPPAHRSRQQRRQGWSQWRRQPGAALRTDERPPPPRYGMVPSDVPSCRGATITALAPPSTRPRARSPALWRPPPAPAASPPRVGRDDNSWRRQRQQAAAQTTRFGDAARPPYVQSSRLARTFEQVSAVAPTAAPMVRPASWRV